MTAKQLKKEMQSSGFQVEKRFEKVMEDPNVKFQTQMTTLGDFKKPTTLQSYNGKHDLKYPRYTKQRSVKENYCDNEKLKKLQEYQRGKYN